MPIQYFTKTIFLFKKQGMKEYFSIFLVAHLFFSINSQTEPILTSWKRSNGTGYNKIEADVTCIRYSSNYVYIQATGIPSYSIGKLIFLSGILKKYKNSSREEKIIM